MLLGLLHEIKSFFQKSATFGRVLFPKANCDSKVCLVGAAVSDPKLKTKQNAVLSANTENAGLENHDSSGNAISQDQETVVACNDNLEQPLTGEGNSSIMPIMPECANVSRVIPSST